LWLVSRRRGIAATVAAVLMATARVYVGAHWHGDVLAGLVLGTAVTVTGYLLLRRPLTALARKRSRRPSPQANCPRTQNGSIAHI
jgi:membrane-associated phospholipid phosphatase